MNFDFDVESLEFDELYRILNDSFELKTKEFDLRNNELDHSILNRNVLTIDDVKDYFDFDNEHGIYKFPYIDERKINQNQFLGMEVFPFKGFYWCVDSKVNERFFGLVDVEFSIKKIMLKNNDERFENIETVFKDVKSFYFDYKDEKYIQINKNGKNEFTEEYLKREEKYFLTLSVIEKEMMSYLVRLEKYQKIFLETPSRFKEYIIYFEWLQKYIENEFKFVHIKVLLKKIDINHYEGLKTFINDSKGFLEGFEKKVLTFPKEKLNMKISDLPEMIDENKKYNQMVIKINTMFKKRDAEKIRKSKNRTSTDGYFQFGSKYYENFVYLEFENLRKTYPDSKENREKERKELERSIRIENNKKNIEKNDDETKNIAAGKGILTRNEINQLENVSEKEQKTFLLEMLIEKSRKGEISKKNISQLLTSILSDIEKKE